MQGIFYGIGVGPGDPELMTVKAIRLIRECDVVAVVVSDTALKQPEFEEAGDIPRYPDYLERCVAYQIALPMVPEMEKKAKLYLPMPMIKEKEILRSIHDACAALAGVLLDQGKTIACITLGDPTLYSTSLYVHKRLKQAGYATTLIPGIPSFCAAAARLDIGLVENKEELHVIPASYEIEESMGFSGTKVLMKAGRKMPYVKQKALETGQQVWMVENCGMENEKVYETAEEIPEDAGYYSLMIMKEGKV